MWRRDWASGHIRPERDPWLLLIGWPLAFVLLGFALRVALEFVSGPVELDLPLVGKLLLIFALPLCLFAALVLATAWRLKYGRSQLVLEMVPVVVGGTLKGRIEAPIRNWTPVAQGKGFSVKLSSSRRRETARRQARSFLRSEEQEVPPSTVGVMGNGVAIPIAFSLPSGALPTDKRYAADQVFWQLDVHAAQPGLDYHEWFDVPVFPATGPGSSGWERRR